jgi:hypothetical protein
MANDILIPPDLNPVSPESVELVDDATQAFVPTLARGNVQRTSFGDPRWRIHRRYSAVRAEDKARLATVLNEARGKYATVRTVPGYVQRGSFPSQEMLPNNTFAAGVTGYAAESYWTLTAKDKVLRATRNTAGNTGFFVVPNVIAGLTQYAAYVARFFLNLGAAFDPNTFQMRVDDYGTLAGPVQLFEPMATGVIVPKTTSARPAVAQIFPAAQAVGGGNYIDLPWVSLTRCALVDAGNNLIVFSDTLSDSSWIKARATLSSNTTTAPDGTVTGDTFAEDATAAATHMMSSSPVTITSSPADVTATAYVKANTRSWCYLGIIENTGNTFAGSYFNISAGTVGTVGNGTNMTDCRASVVALGNGWFKISVVCRKANLATTIQMQLYLATADNVSTYDGNGVNSIFVWRLGCRTGPAFGVPNQTLGVADPGTQYKGGSMNIKGLPASVVGTLLAGDYIEINGELKRVTAPVNSDAAGCATINFRPAMVNPPVDNDPVVIGNPMGRFLASGIKWDSQWGIQEDATLDLDEVYE